jgi:hypothetical protein
MRTSETDLNSTETQAREDLPAGSVESMLRPLQKILAAARVGAVPCIPASIVSRVRPAGRPLTRVL